MYFIYVCDVSVLCEFYESLIFFFLITISSTMLLLSNQSLTWNPLMFLLLFGLVMHSVATTFMTVPIKDSSKLMVLFSSSLYSTFVWQLSALAKGCNCLGLCCLLQLVHFFVLAFVNYNQVLHVFFPCIFFVGILRTWICQHDWSLACPPRGSCSGREFCRSVSVLELLYVCVES